MKVASVRKSVTVVMLAALALVLGASGAWATNITAPDGVGSGTGWYGAQEDQEVEPNCVTGQQWDLEAVLLSGRVLTLVGGFNFRLGQDGYQSGDLFLSNSTPIYGPSADGTGSGNTIVNNDFGYDWVLDIDWATATSTSVNYNVYLLSGFTTAVQTTDVYFAQNQEANPYRFVSTTANGGAAIASGVASLDETYDGSYEGLLGAGSRYGLTFDFSSAAWLTGTELWTHFTQRCGNDNLMGHTTELPGVPEPISMVMLGCMGAGMLGARKIKRWKSEK